MGDCKNCPDKNTGRRLISIADNANWHFSRAEVRDAQKWRWRACSSSSDCGLACCYLFKDIAQNAECVDADTGKVYAPDLYAALKRPEFKCPRGLF